jgi:hypothetical protein
MVAYGSQGTSALSKHAIDDDRGIWRIAKDEFDQFVKIREIGRAFGCNGDPCIVEVKTIVRLP